MLARPCKAVSPPNTIRAVSRYVAHSRRTPLALPFLTRKHTPYATSTAALAASDAKKPQFTEAHIPVLLGNVLLSFSDSKLKVPSSNPLPDSFPQQGTHGCLRHCYINMLLSLQTFVDGTLGAAGHSCAILQAHPVSVAQQCPTYHVVCGHV